LQHKLSHWQCSRTATLQAPVHVHVRPTNLELVETRHANNVVLAILSRRRCTLQGSSQKSDLCSICKCHCTMSQHTASATAASGFRQARLLGHILTLSKRMRHWHMKIKLLTYSTPFGNPQFNSFCSWQLCRLHKHPLDQHTHQHSCAASPLALPSYTYLRHTMWRTWHENHQPLLLQNTVCPAAALDSMHYNSQMPHAAPLAVLLL
jgi:hypothetical protein